MCVTGCATKKMLALLAMLQHLRAQVIALEARAVTMVHGGCGRAPTSRTAWLDAPTRARGVIMRPNLAHGSNDSRSIESHYPARRRSDGS